MFIPTRISGMLSELKKIWVELGAEGVTAVSVSAVSNASDIATLVSYGNFMSSHSLDARVPITIYNGELYSTLSVLNSMGTSTRKFLTMRASFSG